MSAAGNADLVVGVDTHLDTHTAAVCDARGKLLSQPQIPVTPAGYAQLLDAVRAVAGDGRVVWAVEGTRHYGLGLARYLVSQGQQVAETGQQSSPGQTPCRQERPHRFRPCRAGAAGPPARRPDALRRRPRSLAAADD